MIYEFSVNAPEIATEASYKKKASTVLQRLLDESPDNEKKFQDFFEQNPHFLPGSRDEISAAGGSGHQPHLLTLISQPKISGLVYRQPDFMWLASDSVYFTPVIIEIEAPAKKHFKKDGKPTSHFNEAVHQLQEWQTILSRPENILKFYEDFSIPQDLRDLTFKPHFALIYGRRNEFEGDKLLKMKRGNLLSRDQSLMTYDRIKPQYLVNNLVTCTVKQGKYLVKYVSPLFHIGPYDDELLDVNDLETAIANSKSITAKRRSFLLRKLQYCLEFLKKERDGVPVKIKQNEEFQMYE